MLILAKAALIGGSVQNDCYIKVDRGLISGISNGVSEVADLTITGLLIPGFVDTHSHGGGGFSFSTESETGIRKVIATHRAHGTTTQFASLVTEPIDVLKAQIVRLKPFVMRGELAGIHLEGPYLSHEKCGAHDPKLLRLPDLQEISELIAEGEGTIAMMTIAPELKGAISAIELLVDSGIVVAIGHSTASHEAALAAIEAGATVVTHFYNALPAIDHREPTITSTGLLNDALTLELILDGHHVNALAVELMMKSAKNRTILVTDAMSAAGGEDGDYLIGELPVTVLQGVARLQSNGSLAGSTLTMASAFDRLISHHNFDIAAASNAASTLPAEVHGLLQVGEISVGKRANFVELENSLFKAVHTF
jgi:N-acetylglucosamine-6-phosphate deacetylase